MQSDAHYPRIRQSAIEMHDRGQVAEVERLLTAQGYAVTADMGVAYGPIVRAIKVRRYRDRTKGRPGLRPDNRGAG